MFYSPLRYPGGKSRLSKFISQVCVENNIHRHYIEPYAGGASVALHLLIEGKIENITINDLDPAMYAFWYCVLHKTDDLCQLIQSTEVNIENWKKQKEIYKHGNKSSILELGFSVLFLNRTNRSGIIKAGCIGGVGQKGSYRLDCRFNKTELIKRIQRISRYKENIHLYGIDAMILVDKIDKETTLQDVIVFLDPPYFIKGASLYMNYYDEHQHEEISEKIKSLQNIHWIISYDDVPQINGLYAWASSIKYTLYHFANKKKTGKEVLFHSKGIKVNKDFFTG